MNVGHKVVSAVRAMATLGWLTIAAALMLAVVHTSAEAQPGRTIQGQVYGTGAQLAGSVADVYSPRHEWLGSAPVQVRDDTASRKALGVFDVADIPDADTYTITVGSISKTVAGADTWGRVTLNR